MELKIFVFLNISESPLIFMARYSMRLWIY